VQVADSSRLNVTSALTLEGWVYLTSFSGNDSVAIASKENPYGDRQFQLAMVNVSNQYPPGPSAGQWVFRAAVVVPTGFMILNGTTAAQLGTWYHVAMTYDGSQLKLYVNGNLDTSLAVNGPVNVTSNPFRIGGYGTGPWDFLGRVDELGLY